MVRRSSLSNPLRCSPTRFGLLTAAGLPSTIKHAYKKLFLNKDHSLGDLVVELKESDSAEETHVARLIEFISGSERGVIR